MGLGNVSAASRLMAQTAVQNDEGNRTIRKAGYEQAEAQREAKNSQRKLAADIQKASGWVQIAQSTASATQKAVGAVEAGADLASFRQIEPELNAATDQARGGEMAQLLETRLGEDGPTVEERFGAPAAEALMRPDLGARPGESREAWGERVGGSLEQAGFSEGEVEQLHALAKDGKLDDDDRAGFLWTHRKTPEEQQAKSRRDAMIGELIGQISNIYGQGSAPAARHHGETAKAMDELASSTSEVAAEAHRQAADHNEALGELSLRDLRERLGQR